MAITKSGRTSKYEAYAAYSLIDPDGKKSFHEVTEGSHYRFSWYDGGRRNELFHVGGGNPFVTETVYQHDFGTYSLIPNEDFLAWAHIWGAGGGGYNSGNDSARGGGGGFTSALIQFKAGVSYALTVGQAGRYGTGTTTHGGGGGNESHSNNGSGGGLSGIFMNSTHIGRSVWAYNPPFTQSQALAIGGGGGSTGHHSNSHHGTGGGGGGWEGEYGHNSTPGGQYGSGYSSSYQSGSDGNRRALPLHGARQAVQGTWQGAGGGGWWGGGSGAHTSNHHDGGSGGSGHFAYSEEIGSQPNNDKAQYILCANTETSSVGNNNARSYAGNFKTPLAYRSSNPTTGEYDGFYAGKGGHGNSEPTGRSSALHGKIVLTLTPDLISKSFQKKLIRPQDADWTINYVNT